MMKDIVFLSVTCTNTCNFQKLQVISSLQIFSLNPLSKSMLGLIINLKIDKLFLNKCYYISKCYK